MLSFLKKIFGPKPTEASPAPYKVEPVVKVVHGNALPATVKKDVVAKPKAPRKPRTPKV